MKSFSEFRFEGLVAAGFTPMHPDGSIHVAQIPALVDHLIAHETAGIYVCGSTGEGPLLTGQERKEVAEAFIAAGKGRTPILVQVGHTSVQESEELAAHAEAHGADFISACAPSYFRPSSVESLVDCMAQIAAAAPRTPFYYYHIPRLTGADLDMVKFLELSKTAIPTLAGIKYSDLKLFEFMACQAFDNQRYDILWGCDEMLLGALASGAKAAVGSTYNFAAPIYQRVIDAYNQGDMQTAQQWMLTAAELVMYLDGTHGPIHACMKSILGMIGVECGDTRAPIGGIDTATKAVLQAELEAMGFFDWIRQPVLK